MMSDHVMQAFLWPLFDIKIFVLLHIEDDFIMWDFSEVTFMEALKLWLLCLPLELLSRC